MTIYMESDAQISQEAWEILIRHMEPSKLARFWAGQRQGVGDYLKWRDETFAGQSVAELYDTIETYQTVNHSKQ